MVDFPIPSPSPQGEGALSAAVLPNAAFVWSTALLFGDRRGLVRCGEGLGRGLYLGAIPWS